MDCNDISSCNWWWCNKYSGCFLGQLERTKRLYPSGLKKKLNKIVRKRKQSNRKIPKKTRKEVYERDFNSCLKCGISWDLTIDHIVPVSKGGTNEKDNLQTLCSGCNRKKGDKVIDYRRSTVKS